MPQILVFPTLEIIPGENMGFVRNWFGVIRNLVLAKVIKTMAAKVTDFGRGCRCEFQKEGKRDAPLNFD